MSTKVTENKDDLASRVPGSFRVTTNLENFDDNNPRVMVDAGVSIYASSGQSTFVCRLSNNVENKQYDLATSTDEIGLIYIYPVNSELAVMRANSGNATVEWDRAAGTLVVTFECESSDTPGFVAKGDLNLDILGFPGLNWMTALANAAPFISSTTRGFISEDRMIISGTTDKPPVLGSYALLSFPAVLKVGTYTVGEPEFDGIQMKFALGDSSVSDAAEGYFELTRYDRAEQSAHGKFEFTTEEEVKITSGQFVIEPEAVGRSARRASVSGTFEATINSKPVQSTQLDSVLGDGQLQVTVFFDGGQLALSMPQGLATGRHPIVPFSQAGVHVVYLGHEVARATAGTLVIESLQWPGPKLAATFDCNDGSANRLVITDARIEIAGVESTVYVQADVNGQAFPAKGFIDVSTPYHYCVIAETENASLLAIQVDKSLEPGTYPLPDTRVIVTYKPPEGERICGKNGSVSLVKEPGGPVSGAFYFDNDGYQVTNGKFSF
ncbi:hypothetical protein [Pseudomonas petrae]|uniref:Uncharacterized protein n=1 Tax=Pseudomonas petrae TaxID=2912190 RepID=A0ABS9I0G3_9PSED|nr:hypothetical protein [Pseudomonas petrae]MCF7531600.1 hypothetical protein [Pseudomonas petrae]MCF7537163.1 hypothetical protein [Pseudomonas petrae]MCF7540839.1 hypothetical protein [Pseudomonas petrae]MCF7556377.1 hypothetical protein [Pseudomonas petrae]